MWDPKPEWGSLSLRGCRARVPHEGPMKAIRTGAVLSNGVWQRGSVMMTMSPGYG